MAPFSGCRCRVFECTPDRRKLPLWRTKLDELVFAPGLHGFQNGDEAAPSLRQPVFHTRRDLAVIDVLDEAVVY